MASILTSGANGGAPYIMSRIFGPTAAAQITAYYLLLFTGVPPRLQLPRKLTLATLASLPGN